MTSPIPHRPRWRIDEIDFDAIDPALVRNDEFLFTMLACASFVEILAETYSENLIAHFSGNRQVNAWLHCHWQKEEVQHGWVLKAYVQKVWPEFDWVKAHACFVHEYKILCTQEQLETIPALEMVGRCVVETGTATFYSALQTYTSEPVLKIILGNIKRDEVVHYSHFRRYFEDYYLSKNHTIWSVICAMWRRIHAIRNDDVYIAFKHVRQERSPEISFCDADWMRFYQRVRQSARHFYPYTMAVNMLIKPLPVSAPFKAVLRRAGHFVARCYLIL